jgi:hypothetical protein
MLAPVRDQPAAPEVTRFGQRLRPAANYGIGGIQKELLDPG